MIKQSGADFLRRFIIIILCSGFHIENNRRKQYIIFIEVIFMKTRDEAIEVCLRFEDAYEDYPFRDTNWTIMRHKSNNKMFAAIYERFGKIWLNLKAEPMTGDFWKSVYSAVIPAYHMSKEHWISVILDGSMTDDEILPIIEDSFLLTMPKKHKSMQQNR